MSHPLFEIPAFSQYPTFSRDKLLLRLCQLSEELAGRYVEVAYTRAEEFNLKAARWVDSHEDSVTARVNDVSYAAAMQTTSIIELDAQIKSLTEEKFLILKLLEHA